MTDDPNKRFSLDPCAPRPSLGDKLLAAGWHMKIDVMVFDENKRSGPSMECQIEWITHFKGNAPDTIKVIQGLMEQLATKAQPRKKGGE
jgi:hypothetical protein